MRRSRNIEMENDFKPGDLVRVIEDPGKRGVVIGEPGSRGRINVMFNNVPEEVYPDLLEKYEDKNINPETILQKEQYGGVRDLRGAITYYRLSGRLANFHVVRRNAKWSFYFYSNNVQPLGVYNLHAKRIEWWTQKMKQKGYDDALNVLKNYKNLNYQNIPEKFTDYFDNVMINLDPEKDGPDLEFYCDVRQQVTGMIYTPYKEKRLNKNQIRDTPVFYCGGGMRMQFYKRLKCDLKNVPGTSWLSTNEITLKLPEKFDVHDISNCDFDRLSVAYGLSTISVDDIFKVEPLTNNEMQIVSELYKERFISKDMI